MLDGRGLARLVLPRRADLTVASAWRNGFRSLPPRLFSTWRSNGLRTLPRALADHPRLRTLDLRWNRDPRPPRGLRRLERRGCLVYR